MTDKRVVRLGHRTAYDQPRVKRRDNQEPGARHEKRCSRCKRLLPLTAFNKFRDSYRPECRECQASANARTVAKRPENYTTEVRRARYLKSVAKKPGKYTPEYFRLSWLRTLAKNPQNYTSQAIRERNPHLYTSEVIRARRQRCIATKPDHYRQIIGAASRRYMMSKLRARPPWAGKGTEVEAAINAIYQRRDELTASTGVVHEVDHLYPVRGNLASGLDLPWNLHVITEAENGAKSNRRPELFYSTREFQRIIKRLNN